MINVILLLIIFVCLNKWFYHTVIVLALWWQVLNNLYLQPYSFTGVCALLIAICFISKIIKKEILWNSFPLRIPFLFLFICYCVSVFNGAFNIGSLLSVLKIFVIPISSYFAIQKISNFWNFLLFNILIFVSVILGVGFVELNLGFNPVILWLQSVNIGDYSAEQREGYIRFGMYRCQSLMVWCSTYGVICGFTALLLLLLNYYKRFKLPLLVVLMSLLLLFGMFTCGTRSVFVAISITLLAYVFQAVFKFKYLLGGLLLLLCAYYLFPDFFDQVLLSLTDTSSVGGSDTDLRQSQLKIALREFSNSPFIGNGAGRCAYLVNRNIGLYGAESFLFWTLIDRGIMGLVCSLILLFSTIKYLKKQNFLLCFIPLGIMVGKYSSLFPDIEETYYFFYLFIVLRAYQEFKTSKKFDKEKNKNESTLV